MGVLVIVTGVFENIVIVDRAYPCSIINPSSIERRSTFDIGNNFRIIFMFDFYFDGFASSKCGGILPKSFHLALLEEQLLSDVG